MSFVKLLPSLCFDMEAVPNAEELCENVVLCEENFAEKTLKNMV